MVGDPDNLLKSTMFLRISVETVEELSYQHAMGGLTIHCRYGIFIHIISHLNDL